MCITKYPEIFDALSAPFHRDNVKQKMGYDYITTRTVMNRLDEVVGPENWWDEREDTKRGVKCRLTIRMPDGVTISHEGHARHMPDPPRSAHAAERIAEMPEEIVVKGEVIYPREKAERSEELRRWDAIQLADDGAEADAFKRAAVKFGVFRYGYKDGVVVHGVPAADATQSTLPAVRKAITGAPVTAQPPAPVITAGPPRPEIDPATVGVIRDPAPPAPRARRESPIKSGGDLLRWVSGRAGGGPELHIWIIRKFVDNPSDISRWTQTQVAAALPEIKEYLTAAKLAVA